jgi:hypothetical protein
MPLVDIEKRKAYMREHYKTHKKDHRHWSWKYSLKKNYGMTVEQYDALLLAQDGRCAICGTDKPYKNKDKLCVDHDHITGIVRGLLCDRCNGLLGNAFDSVATLEKAIKYLRGFGY